ncbi:MAG: class I SAM-dependent methyltransferase family protein [Promethearchaeota archaeon]|nr:MAG: class I SAM-dependent methyltransferase family protein [Candidatus Lokiarchaeota archaeon]
MGFKDQLKNKLKEHLPEDELSKLPGGFQSIGKVMILKLDPSLLKHKEIIGNACLALYPRVRSVYLNSGKIKGKFRKPESIKLIVGENNPLVIHTEHGVKYKFDMTKIMFSKGNLNERKYLATLVKDGEIIVDMFAGIGYFSLPIAKHSRVKKIYSIELNPISYKYLVENIKINKFDDLIVPISGDCKAEVIKLSKNGIKADRVIMGVFPAPRAYIKEALSLVKEEGTTFHYEGVVDKDHYLDLFDDFQDIAEKNGYTCELKSYRAVKSFGPNLYHYVLDIETHVAS